MHFGTCNSARFLTQCRCKHEERDARMFRKGNSWYLHFWNSLKFYDKSYSSVCLLENVGSISQVERASTQDLYVIKSMVGLSTASLKNK